MDYAKQNKYNCNFYNVWLVAYMIEEENLPSYL